MHFLNRNTEVRVLADKTRGIVRLIGSILFLFLAFVKILDQPLSGLLYTSRVTIALFLLTSVILAASALFLLIKPKEMHNREDNYK